MIPERNFDQNSEAQIYKADLSPLAKSPEAFWKKLAEDLLNNPRFSEIEIPGQGTFQREMLKHLFRLEIHVAPQKLHSLVKKLEETGIFLAYFKLEDFPPLHKYVIAGREEGIAEEIKNTSDVNATDSEGYSALQWASLLGENSAVKSLLQAGAKINVGTTPAVHQAALTGNLEGVTLLLASGADINQRDSAGRTLLASSAFAGKTNVVQMLLERGVDPNPSDHYGTTPLMFAAEKGHVDAVEWLLLRGADPNRHNFEGDTALLLAANKHTAVGKLLLQHGADPNCISRQGKTALLAAALGGNIQMLRALLAHQADANVYDIEGFPLLYTLQSRHPPHWQLMQQLIKVNTSKCIQHVAISYNSTKLLTNAFAFTGSSNVQGRKIDWESQHPAIAAHEMARSIPLFAAETSFLDENTARHLSQSLHFASDQAIHKPKDILARIKRGQPTVILTGFESHVVTILIWKDIFVLCNRGGLARRPLEIYRYNSQLLDLHAVMMLLAIQNMSADIYAKVCFEKMPKDLHFTQTENEMNLEKLIELPKQMVANCSWASTEGIVKVLFALEQLNDFQLPQETETLKSALDNTFANWQVHQQIKLLREYISTSPDHDLVVKSFQELWKSKRLTSQMEVLEKEYLQIVPSEVSQNFRTAKAFYRVTPPDKTDRVGGMLGALSLIFSLGRSA